MSIGQRIRELRNMHRISQAKLAAHLGVSAGNVGEWELGRAKPGADALIALSKFFGVLSDWILTGEEPVETQFQDYNKEDYQLLPDERELLAKWRHLSERQKGRIEGHIDEMLGWPETSRKLSSPSIKGDGREEAAAKQSAG